MSLLNSVKNYMWGVDPYEDYDDYNGDYANDTQYEMEADEFEQYKANRKSEKTSKKSVASEKNTEESNIVSLYDNQKSYVVITTPKNINDSLIIIDNVKDNKLCIVNLEGVTFEEAQKIADFLSGAVYALSGEIKRISNDIFVCASANVDITGAIEETLKSTKNGNLPMFTI